MGEVRRGEGIKGGKWRKNVQYNKTINDYEIYGNIISINGDMLITQMLYGNKTV